MVIDNLGFWVFFGVLTVVSPLIVGIVLNRQIEQVHTLVNSQKTTLEQQLAAAITEIVELKGQLMLAVQQIGVLQERGRTG